MSNTHSTSKKKRPTVSGGQQSPVTDKSADQISNQKNVPDIEEEPVSLAEEIAVEIEQQGPTSNDNTAAPKKTDIHVGELQRMSV